MPKVGDEKFPYTKKGEKAAKKKSVATGNPVRMIPTSKGMRDPKTVLEGFMGKGTAPNPMPSPMHEMPKGHMMPDSAMPKRRRKAK